MYEVFSLCWRLPIFPGRFQPSIVSASELNFRVRDGNGCTLTAIDTNFFLYVAPRPLHSVRLSLCYVRSSARHKLLPAALAPYILRMQAPSKLNKDVFPGLLMMPS